MKKLLVVVDYQNDFVDGALGFKGAEKIEKEIINLINEFEKEQQDIVFTLDTHDENYLTTVEGKNLPIPHCLKNTKGHELTDGLKPYVKEHPIFEKESFGSLALGEFIKDNNYDEIVFCGLVSDICVFNNAIIAKAAAGTHAEIKVIKKATSSNDLSVQEDAFKLLKHLHIQVL